MLCGRKIKVLILHKERHSVCVMESALLLIAFFALIVALVLLGILAVIDFKTMYLPNKYVFPFAVLAVIFHTSLQFSVMDPLSMLIGGAFGYGILWSIRFFGNMYYKTDSLGLGDVKLLGAAGLWLGLSGVTIAMTLGAAAGLVHGLIVAYVQSRKTGEFNVRRLKIPAGPGFIIGITIVIFWEIFPVFLR
jgi:leader peptidase (prepilin peptidase)/N-methyltransferase